MLRRLSKDRVRRVSSGWVHHVKTHVIFNARKKLSSGFVSIANRLLAPQGRISAGCGFAGR